MAKFMKTENYCQASFMKIEIHSGGDIYPCCPYDIDNYSFGNLYKNSITEIWNSEKAQNFRAKMLCEDYSACNKNRCYFLQDLDTTKEEDLKTSQEKVIFGFEHKTIVKNMPTEIYLCYDTVCDSKCIFCRDEIIDNNSNTNDKLSQIILENADALFQNAKKVYLNGGGEIFFSKNSRKLIKHLTEKFPDIKYDIITNGHYFTSSFIKTLNLQNKINSVAISIHATTNETYQKIFRSEFDLDSAVKALDICSQMKINGEISKLDINFVVSALNYKEMPDFAELAVRFGAIAHFWCYEDQNFLEMSKNNEKYCVFNPEHPEHENLLNILLHEIFDLDTVRLNPHLTTLRKKALNQNPTTKQLNKILYFNQVEHENLQNLIEAKDAEIAGLIKQFNEKLGCFRRVVNFIYKLRKNGFSKHQKKQI